MIDLNIRSGFYDENSAMAHSAVYVGSLKHGFEGCPKPMHRQGRITYTRRNIIFGDLAHARGAEVARSLCLSQAIRLAEGMAERGI